jgi:hypothetical protein
MDFYVVYNISRSNYHETSLNYIRQKFKFGSAHYVNADMNTLSAQKCISHNGQVFGVAYLVTVIERRCHQQRRWPGVTVTNPEVTLAISNCAPYLHLHRQRVCEEFSRAGWSEGGRTATHTQPEKTRVNVRKCKAPGPL